MACLGLHAVNNGGVSAQEPGFLTRKTRGQPPSRVAMRRFPVTATAAVVAAPPQFKAARGGEKLDQWMKESVSEIVKNLREGPLFVHVYGGGLETRVKTERAVAEDWAHLKGKWVKGEEPTPEGIILVEELKEDDVEILEKDEGQIGECTKSWGVLIQGKGDDGGVACYLLKTSRVGCGGGLGLFCTHYCLVRVKSFRETARSQLTSCWLM